MNCKKDRATAFGHGSGAGGTHSVAYPEWPAFLGDPRRHHVDIDDVSAQSRASIIARFRARRPDEHQPVSAKSQRQHIQSLNEVKFSSRKCSFQVRCHRADATIKCQQCVKFDALHLGYYCNDCFISQHPSYRLPHVWTPIEEELNPDQTWLTHITQHNLEQDAQEVALLLQETQSFLSGQERHAIPTELRTSTQQQALATVSDSSSIRIPTGELDFNRAHKTINNITSTLRDLMNQIETELAKKPSMTREEALVKIQTMWRIRKARKQMKAMIRSVYQSFQDPTTGETYYYNSRTKETQWVKPKGLGSDGLKGPSKNQEKEIKKKKRGTLATISTDTERREYAARCIQGMARSHSARSHMRKLISSIYEKIWDKATSRFYYHNTRTEQVKWERPRWVNDSDLLTPRRRQAQEDAEMLEAKNRKIERLRLDLTEDGAARMLQRAFRWRRGFRTLLAMCRNVYERIYDSEREMYYYHNTRTKEVSWEKPLLLRNANADVFSPRTRKLELPTQTLNHVKEVRSRRVWTEDSAATRLQGLYRARRAKQELDERLVQVYRKVLDADTGLYYYANLKTGEVSWEVPAIMQRRKAVSVSVIQ